MLILFALSTLFLSAFSAWTYDPPRARLKPLQVANTLVLKGEETAPTAKPFFVLPGRIGEDVISNALREVQGLHMDNHEDEADWLPAYEAYIMEQALMMPGLGQGLQAAVKTLESATLPLVQEMYACEMCVACTAFVRRYLQQERVRVPAHFDVTAYATVILPLSPARNYSGGFFVQPTAHVDSRLFVPLELGDVAVHDFTLNHGIEVFEGGRYSLILWISEKFSACKHSRTPWHAQRALQGDAVAQHILGMMFSQGNGAPKDDAQALEWTLRAAWNGLANAQYSAGTLYFEGKGAAVDYNRSFFWYEKAAGQGDASSQLIIARMYEEGLGVPADPNLAAYWYHLASMQSAKGLSLAGPTWPTS